jgi:TRAP-type C4-dicarboxylate transport system permease small subunit
MGIDIRMPIGLMFTVFGILITVYGVITNSNTAMYEKSLNININIWMGVFMLIFGLIMLFFAIRKKTVKE